MTDFTKTITDRLDSMTFHEKQELVRTVLDEVVIDRNTVKLLFKIPLPKTRGPGSGNNNPGARKSVSTELDLRSRCGHRAYLEELTSGRHDRLGDAIRAAQEAYAATGALPELLTIYHLFGDPATKIKELRE